MDKIGPDLPVVVVRPTLSHDEKIQREALKSKTLGAISGGAVGGT